MATEDFTTYTEVDASNYLTVAASLLTGNGDSDDDCYIYLDKTAGHFGDFEHLFELKNTGTGGGKYYPWNIANSIGDFRNTLKDTDGLSLEATYKGAAVQLKLYDNWGAAKTNFSSTISQNTLYYGKMVRSGSTYSGYIYSDSARTNLVSSATITGADTTTARYIYGWNTENRGSTGKTFAGTLGALDLQEGGADVLFNVASEMTAAATMYADTVTADALFSIAAQMASTATMYADTTTADALFSVAAEMTATATMYADTVTADALFNVAAAMTSLATVYEEIVTATSPDVTINIASEMTATATMYADTTTADALFTIASEMTATAIMYADTITADALFNVSSEMASAATMYADTTTADALFNIAAEMTALATMYADTTTADCDISVNVMTAAAAMNSASITGTALVQLSTMAATATVYAVTVTTGEGGEEIVFVHLPLVPHMPTIAPGAVRDDGVD